MSILCRDTLCVAKDRCLLRQSIPKIHNHDGGIAEAAGAEPDTAIVGSDTDTDEDKAATFLVLILKTGSRPLWKTCQQE